MAKGDHIYIQVLVYSKYRVIAASFCGILASILRDELALVSLYQNTIYTFTAVVF